MRYANAPVSGDVVVAGIAGGGAEQHGIAQIGHGSGDAGTSWVGPGSESQHDTGSEGSTTQQEGSVGATQQTSGAANSVELSGPQRTPHSPLETSCPKTANRMVILVSIRTLLFG